MRIKNLNQISNLQELTLDNNPLSGEKNYKRNILAQLVALKKLDSKKVTVSLVIFIIRLYFLKIWKLITLIKDEEKRNAERMYCKSEMKKRELENYYSLEVNSITYFIPFTSSNFSVVYLLLQCLDFQCKNKSLAWKFVFFKFQKIFQKFVFFVFKFTNRNSTDLTIKKWNFTSLWLIAKMFEFLPLLPLNNNHCQLSTKINFKIACWL